MEHRRRPPNDYIGLRVNGGVPRYLALKTLQTPHLIAQAVRQGKCFQCFDAEIDATGLCVICRAYLNDEERQAAQRYYDS